MNEATKRLARVVAPWLLQKYHAAKKYLESIVSYMRFAPNKHKKDLRNELARTEGELHQIEADIQNKINEKFEDVEVAKVAKKLGNEAAEIAKKSKI
jgi:hypothetical protein